MTDTDHLDHCPHCGSEYQPGQGVCRACGRPIRSPPLRGLVTRIIQWLAPKPIVSRKITREVRILGEPVVRKGTLPGPPDLRWLPPEAREFIEEARAHNPNATIKIEVTGHRPVRTVSQSITVTEGGRTRTFKSVEDMPPDLRKRYKEVIQQAKQDDAASGQITIEIDGVKRVFTGKVFLPPQLAEKVEGLKIPPAPPRCDKPSGWDDV